MLQAFSSLLFSRAPVYAVSSLVWFEVV